jgi:deoxyribodipyrimidine photo-lyase
VPVALVVFTRDLRIRDNTALAVACRAGSVVPAFVFDDAILASNFNRPNRSGFLLESLADLDASMRELGGALATRRGTWVDEVLRLAREVDAAEVHVSDDVSGFARRRLDELERAAVAARVGVHRHPGVTVIPPGAVVPTAGDHFKVFTPYFRRWSDTPLRPVAHPPRRVTVPDDLAVGALPALADLVTGERSPDRMRGGETEARRRLNAWTRSHLAAYPEGHDDLAGDATARISPYLHFGCISPSEVVQRLRDHPGADAFVRQLCWRDFYHQVLAARPDAAWSDYRSRGDGWHDDPGALAAWQRGRTGYPVVDAGMRQLAREGFMHNRARMVVASFLTKDLYVDWRLGARHFLDLLLDGDLANNNLNWQWTAGTGTDTNPHRIYNPRRQAERFDPDGGYVRRYVAELADVTTPEIFEPTSETRRRVGYPAPIVDHHEAIAAYKARRDR